MLLLCSWPSPTMSHGVRREQEALQKLKDTLHRSFRKVGLKTGGATPCAGAAEQEAGEGSMGLRD